MASLAILIPAMRPHRLPDVIASIQESTSDYRIVVIATGECAEAAKALPVDLVEDQGGTWSERLNRGYRITNESVVFTGADDLRFHPGWFEAVTIAMNQFPNGYGVVAVNDQHNRAGVHFAISKRYIDEIGGVIDQPPGVIACEAYRHAYSDDELRSTAMFHNRFVWCESAVVEHMHAGAGKAPNDEVYEIGNASMGPGLTTYQSRAHLWQHQ